MAYRDNVNTFLSDEISSRAAPATSTSGEALENCGHGNHKKYFQGIMTYTSKKNIDAKYLTIGYQNSITQLQCKSILTSRNTNNNRNKKTASERGQGIDELFLKFGKQITILTYNDTTQGYISYEWQLEQQSEAVSKIKNDGPKDGNPVDVNAIANNYVNIKISQDEEDLNMKIINLRNRIKEVCNRNSIDYPKTIFFILLRDEYQNPEIYNIQERCIDFFSKKYAHLDIDIYFLKEDPKKIEDLIIHKLEKKDIVGYSNKQDTIQFKVKIWGKDDVLIKFCGKSQSYYFSLKPEGSTRPNALQNLCEKDGNLIKDIRKKYIDKIKNWNDEECSFTVEYYCVRLDQVKEEMKKEIQIKTYAGIYIFLEMLNTKGHMLLNTIPFKVEEIFANTRKEGGYKNVQHVGGSLFRCVIKVNNKIDIMNPAPRRIETKLKDYTKTVLGSLHAVVHRQFYRHKWWKQGKLCTTERKSSSFVHKDKVKDLLFDDVGQRKRCEKFFNSQKASNNEIDLPHIIPQSKKKNSFTKEDGPGSWYAKLYRKETELDDEIQVDYIIKQGTCFSKRRNARSTENDAKFKKENFVCISETTICVLLGDRDKRLEFMVKKYWENHDNYSPKVVKGHSSDQCLIYDYKHWIDFKEKMNNIENMVYNLEIKSDEELEKEFNK